MVNYSDDTNLKFDLAGMELQKRVKPMLLLAEDWIDCRLVFEYLKDTSYNFRWLYRLRIQSVEWNFFKSLMKLWLSIQTLYSGKLGVWNIETGSAIDIWNWNRRRLIFEKLIQINFRKRNAFNKARQFA